MPQHQHWTQRIVTIGVLPGSVFLSTLVLTQSQIGRLFSSPAWWHILLWATWEWVLPWLIVYGMWRHHWPAWQWRDVAMAWGETAILAGVSLISAWQFTLLAIDVQPQWPQNIAVLALIVPLALWCAAEEYVLRVLLVRQYATAPYWVRVAVPFGIAVGVQWTLSQQWSWIVFGVVVLGELVSSMSWYWEKRFGLLWARRLSWRWVAAVLCGLPSMGMTVALPHPVVVVPASMEVGGLLVMTWLLAWCTQLLMQRYVLRHSAVDATFSKNQRHTP